MSTGDQPTSDGVAPRRLAIEALVRIEAEGAYANLVLADMLERSGLPERERAFVTTLVYGTTRMRRSCAWLVDRFLTDAPPPAARAALAVGAYQLAFLHTPAHAAVDATVSASPRRFRGLVNAVLRKVAGALPAADGWPDEPTRLSYPTWIVERLRTDLGEELALGALEVMNEPPPVHVRADGYVQDLASQWVAAAVGAREGDVVADLCAAPGGKATAMAAGGATVVAADVRWSRVTLLAGNVARLAAVDPAASAGRVVVVAADAAHPPFRNDSMDRVLVDAPCSGLGTLRRRPDARWRIEVDDVGRLAALQRTVVSDAAGLVRPGGVLVYSVCTLTGEETLDVDAHLAEVRPDFEPLEPPSGPWHPWGRGALLVPQAADTDGMFLLALRRRG
ncbi:MAG: hypothetical protein JJU45_13185 [Acidimicrobiia bacterium]|nr:hypothetical protein [Acidimicrobiia bacterium]